MKSLQGMWTVLWLGSLHVQGSLSTADFLLVADGNQIVQVDSETMNHRQMSINVTSQPQVLVYDWQRREVYWTSAVNTSSIFKCSFDDDKTTVVYVEPTMNAVYSGLTIDVSRRLLYLSDEGQGQITELELNYTDEVTSRIIDSTSRSKPRSIVVDTVNRILYWTDMEFGLFSLSLSDGTKTPLTRTSQHYRSRVLAVDFAGQILYFIDKKHHTPMFFNLSSSRFAIISRQNLRAFSIVVDASYMYLSNDHLNIMQKRRLTSFSHGDEAAHFNRPRGLALSSEASPATRRPCCYYVVTPTTTPGLLSLPAIIGIAASLGLLLVIVIIIIIVCCVVRRSRRRPEPQIDQTPRYSRDSRPPPLPQRPQVVFSVTKPESADVNDDYIDVASPSRDSTGDYLVPDVVPDEYISPSDRAYVSIIEDRDSRGDYLHPDTYIDRHSYIEPIE